MARFTVDVPPEERRGEELSARADEIARRWLTLEVTPPDQFSFHDPLRPGENP